MIAKKGCKGFLIDGFPRDVDQGVKFENTVSIKLLPVILYIFGLFFGHK